MSTNASNRSRLQVLWDGFVGAIGAIVGIAPHVLHHAGVLVGTAFVVGTLGTVLFGVIGLVASVPFLIRLHRRFGTWRAPAIALLIFAATFSLSAFVVGPAIRDGSGPAQPEPTPTADHTGHH